MNKLNVIGVDLAKNVIQVSMLSHTNRELANRSLTRRKFAEFLGKQKLNLVAFEACAMAHHWARTAQRHGHEVDADAGHGIPSLPGSGLSISRPINTSSARSHDQIEAIRIGEACSALRPDRPSTQRGPGARIY